ncbi:MAG TPA: hypothetical protein VJH25_00590 [Candidatus Paceibacterota bacterium]
MIKKLLGRFSSKREPVKKSDAFYQFVTHAGSKENEKIFQEAGKLANEEQRKIYYGNARKSEA